MEKKIILGCGTIGHVDHGKTTLSSAIAKIVSEQHQNIIVFDNEPKTGFEFKGPPKLEVPEFIFTTPMTRKERRAKERKNKK